MKCFGINNPFALDQLILFDLLLRMNTVILSLSDYVIRFTYSGLTSSSLQRFLTVVKNVLFQDGKVELFASFAVERDASDFTFLFVLTGLIAIILRTS